MPESHARRYVLVVGHTGPHRGHRDNGKRPLTRIDHLLAVQPVLSNSFRIAPTGAVVNQLGSCECVV